MRENVKKAALVAVSLIGLLFVLADMPNAGLLAFMAVKGASLLALWWSADKLCDLLPPEEV